MECTLRPRLLPRVVLSGKHYFAGCSGFPCPNCGSDGCGGERKGRSPADDPAPASWPGYEGLDALVAREDEDGDGDDPASEADMEMLREMLLNGDVSQEMLMQIMMGAAMGAP